jgi:hypothetical protein
MTPPEKTAIASHAAVILLCGVVSVCAVILTRSANKSIAGVNATLTNKGE